MKKRWLLALVVIICGVAGAAPKAYQPARTTEAEPAIVQDAFALDRRISSIEQRIYAVESSMSRLEQQVSMSQRSVPNQATRDPLADLLRSEVETLKVRVRELECGLVHLDERTLSPGSKEARRKAGPQSTDTCRVDPETPVKLSMRP